MVKELYLISKLNSLIHPKVEVTLRNRFLQAVVLFFQFFYLLMNDIFLKSYINGNNYFDIGKTKEEIYDFCHQIFGKDFEQYIK